VRTLSSVFSGSFRKEGVDRNIICQIYDGTSIQLYGTTAMQLVEGQVYAKLVPDISIDQSADPLKKSQSVNDISISLINSSDQYKKNSDGTARRPSDDLNNVIGRLKSNKWCRIYFSTGNPKSLADCYQHVSGSLVETPEIDENTVRFRISNLLNTKNIQIPKFTTGHSAIEKNFPNMPASSRNKPLPLVYGVADSYNSEYRIHKSSKGMFPTVFLGTDANGNPYYLVASHSLTLNTLRIKGKREGWPCALTPQTQPPSYGNPYPAGYTGGDDSTSILNTGSWFVLPWPASGTTSYFAGNGKSFYGYFEVATSGSRDMAGAGSSIRDRVHIDHYYVDNTGRGKYFARNYRCVDPNNLGDGSITTASTFVDNFVDKTKSVAGGPLQIGQGIWGIDNEPILRKLCSGDVPFNIQANVRNIDAAGSQVNGTASSTTYSTNTGSTIKQILWTLIYGSNSKIDIGSLSPQQSQKASNNSRYAICGAANNLWFPFPKPVRLVGNNFTTPLMLLGGITAVESNSPDGILWNQQLLTIGQLRLFVGANLPADDKTLIYAEGSGRGFDSWIDHARRSNTYSSGQVIEDPAFIIESILRRELGLAGSIVNESTRINPTYTADDSVADTEIDTESFDLAGFATSTPNNARIKMKVVLNEQKPAFEHINNILKQSTLWLSIDPISRVRCNNLNGVTQTYAGTDMVRRFITRQEILPGSLKISYTDSIVNKLSVETQYQHEYQAYSGSFDGNYQVFDKYSNPGSRSSYGECPMDKQSWNYLDRTSANYLAGRLVGDADSVLARTHEVIEFATPSFYNCDLQLGDWISLDSQSCDPWIKRPGGSSWLGARYCIISLSQQWTQTKIKAVKYF
jgi:hypothetical protein